MITRNNFSNVDNLELMDSLGIQFTGRTSAPADADLAAGRVYFDSTLSAFRGYDGSSWTNFGGGGGGGGETLDETYQNGRTINLSLGAIVLNDATSAAANTVEINKTGAGSGNILDFDFSAAFTGNVFNVDFGSAVAASGLVLDSEGTARTGSDIVFTDDSTSAHSCLDINHSGAAAGIGLDYTSTYTGSDASFAVKITQGNGYSLDGTALQIVRGTGARTTPAIDINDASTGSADLIDIDLTGVFTGDVFDFASGAAATGNVFFVNLDNAVAMTALHVEGSGIRTQAMIEVATDCTGLAHLVDFTVTGALGGNVLDFSMDAASTGVVISIDMNASVGGKAIYLDGGAATRTEVMVDVLADGDGNADCFNLDESNTGSGNLFDINVSGIGSGNVIDITYSAADTGDALKVVMADNVAGGALVITAAGARTDSLIDIATSETGSVDGIIRLDASGVFTGYVMTLTSSAAATTGSLLHLDLDAGVAYKALVIDHAGARTVADVLVTFDGTAGGAAGGTFLDGNITMTGAGANPWIDIDVTGVYTGNIFDVVIGAAAATGDVISIDLGATATTAQAMVVASGAMDRSVALFAVTDAGTSSGAMFDINETGIVAGIMFDIDQTAACTGNIFDYATNSASTGTIFEVTLANAVGAKLQNFTLSGNRTVNAMTLTASNAGAVDFWQIDDSGTRSGHVWDVNVSGNSTGNVLDITFSAAAVDGDAISLDLTTNLAGSAVVVVAAGARTDDLFKIDDSSTSNSHVFDINLTGINTGNVFDLTYSVAAATGDAIKLAMGTNVAGRALYVTSAGTGVNNQGSILDVAHTGNLVAGADLVRISSTGSPSSTSNLLALEQSTGAGTAGARCLYISATGTNVEALQIAAGLFFQSTTTANGAGDNETLATSANISFYDPNGASRTGVILADGLVDGQQVTVVNIADANETITFAASGTSKVAGGASVSLAQFASKTFTWSSVRSLWYGL